MVPFIRNRLSDIPFSCTYIWGKPIEKGMKLKSQQVLLLEVTGTRMWCRLRAVCEGYRDASQGLIKSCSFYCVAGTFISFASLNSTHIHILCSLMCLILQFTFKSIERTERKRKGKTEGLPSKRIKRDSKVFPDKVTFKHML